MTSPFLSKHISKLCSVLLVGAVGWATVGCSSQGAGSEQPAQSGADEVAEPTPRVIRRDQAMMGTQFSIQVVDTDERRAAEAIDAAFSEVARVEALISEWRDSSQISRVNRRAAERPVAVGPELFEVVQRGVELSAKTDGAFDLTFASCGDLWSFRERRVPDRQAIEECLPRIDYRSIVLDEADSTIALSRPGSKIGVGGIGKGYGVDRAAGVLEAHGLEHYIVDGGGDLRVRGRRIDRPWTVGVAHPRRKGELLATLSVDAGAVVTSGDYERFFRHAGKLYHHILDPRTGQPADKSAAVTVIAEDATTADALSTGLFVLGPAAAMELVRSMDGVEALVIDRDLQRYQSSGFESYVVAWSE